MFKKAKSKTKEQCRKAFQNLDDDDSLWEERAMEQDAQEDEMELEDCLGGDALRDLLKEPSTTRGKQKEARPSQVIQAQKRVQLIVEKSSDEFKTFVRKLENRDNCRGNRCYDICLTCWQFMSNHQRQKHESMGHQCVGNGVVRSESAFMHYAHLFKRTAGEHQVIIFSPYSRENPAKMQLINSLTHDNKALRENRGNIKGQPPYLAAPLVPFNMVPQNVNPIAIAQRVNAQRRQQSFA